MIINIFWLVGYVWLITFSLIMYKKKYMKKNFKPGMLVKNNRTNNKHPKH